MVAAKRESHPELHVRRKMLALGSLDCGLKRKQTAQVAGVGLATVEQYVAASRDVIRVSFENQPVRTTAEACKRTYQLTGLQWRLSQTRKFLKDMGLQWQRGRAFPVPPRL